MNTRPVRWFCLLLLLLSAGSVVAREWPEEPTSYDIVRITYPELPSGYEVRGDWGLYISKTNIPKNEHGNPGTPTKRHNFAVNYSGQTREAFIDYTMSIRAEVSCSPRYDQDNVDKINTPEQIRAYHTDARSLVEWELKNGKTNESAGGLGGNEGYRITTVWEQPPWWDDDVRYLKGGEIKIKTTWVTFVTGVPVPIPCTVYVHVNQHVLDSTANLGDQADLGPLLEDMRREAKQLQSELDAMLAGFRLAAPGERVATPGTASNPPSAPKSDDETEIAPWQVAVGAGAAGAAAVAVAATMMAAISRRVRRRKEDQPDDESEEEDVVGHVLQVSDQDLSLRPGESATLEVKVHEVTRAGAFRRAAKASLQLIPDGSWSGSIRVRPAKGGATLKAVVSLEGKPGPGTGVLQVKASTPSGDHSTTVRLSLTAEPTLECDPEQVELAAMGGGSAGFTVWVENPGESQWAFDASFEDGDVPISLELKDTEKPAAKHLMLTEAVPAGTQRPDWARDSHKLILTARRISENDTREEQPLERHVRAVLLWEGLFLASTGRSSDERWHLTADGTPDSAEVDFYALALDATGKPEEDPQRLGLDRLAFEPGECDSERNRNLAEAAELESRFVKFRRLNESYAVYRIQAKRRLPGNGDAIHLPWRAALPGRDPETFSIDVPLSLETEDTEPLSKSWEIELARCRRIIDEYVPPGHRQKFHQRVDQRKMLLGAEGLCALRKKIWSVAYELILAEGAEGYKAEALWADRVVTLLEYTQWGADLAFGAVSNMALGPFAPFAQLLKTQVTSVLVAHAEGVEPDAWLDTAWNQAKGFAEGKVVDVDTISKLGTQNKAVLWSIYCGYYFFKGIFYDKKSISDAALDTLREVRDEALGAFFGKRLRGSVDSGAVRSGKPADAESSKPADPSKVKAVDTGTHKAGSSPDIQAPDAAKPGSPPPATSVKAKAPQGQAPRIPTQGSPEPGVDAPRTASSQATAVKPSGEAAAPPKENGTPSPTESKPSTADASPKVPADSSKLAPAKPPLPERNKAWETARQDGKQKVESFRKALQEGTPDQKKAAALAIQIDKQALWEINRSGDDKTKQAMIDQMKRIYDEVDRKTKQDLADQLNENRARQIEQLRKSGRGAEADILARAPDLKPDDIEVFNPTNPRKEIKVGADRDVTMRYTPRPGEYVNVPMPGKPGSYVLGKVDPDGMVSVRNARGKEVKVKAEDVDVPYSMLENAYNRHFYENVTGKPAATASKQEIEHVAHEYDQCCTDRLHPEAYGRFPWDLETAIGKPGQQFTDPQQVGQAAAFKGHHWFRKAEAARASGNHAEAETNMAEGMRQMTKQWKNQVGKRREALSGPPHNLSLKPADARLQKAISIMEGVEKQACTPAEAEARLMEIGYTPDSVATDVGKQIETLQKLQPAPQSSIKLRPTCPLCGNRLYDSGAACPSCNRRA